MSYHGQKLINLIKDNISAMNLELIRKEFQYIEDSNNIKKSVEQICSLISIVGNYLVTAENQKLPEEFAIFDAFCCLDFMSEFLKLSSYDYYKIDLQLIKMLSFLLINIKNKPWLYYLCSNNLLNKIISKDYSKYDDEFLSYYVNFLKSLILLLDETSIQLFYIEKNSSFPLIENILKFYNHKDSMIRNVVRNTVMNIFKVKNAKIEEYDTIFLGFPIWWYVAPTIINTFLESYDFSGKTIVLFATSGGSKFGKAVDGLKSSVSPDTIIKEGKILNGRLSEDELRKWADEF